MERRLQRKIARRSRKIRHNIFIVLTLAIVLCLGTFALAGTQKTEDEIYYESVMIHWGDTLWDIAEEYKTEGEKTEHMISKIVKLNSLNSDNIRAGERLIVPVAKTEA